MQKISKTFLLILVGLCELWAYCSMVNTPLSISFHSAFCRTISVVYLYLYNCIYTAVIVCLSDISLLPHSCRTTTSTQLNGIGYRSLLPGISGRPVFSDRERNVGENWTLSGWKYRFVSS